MSLTVKVIEPSGILDGIRGNILRREVGDILESGADILLIDLKDVKFIDSSGLGALVSAMQMVRKANSKLFVCSVSDQVRMLFELTKMDRIFQTFIDQEDFERQILAIQ
ncbi:STAS domain-containing protein [Calothrix sp. PCC 7507]|uniref:STAS domain-containing protein n=1 Tax=Calothrix sp. PCC 7507 TaxID=99598 RepID=UPI00029F4189|nr:STAS domain-containing protein [Calothrix sp. PCC 7507]AFY31430.1 anti-sigma-factor antagonist [Calothrix sp. PCC 7507]